MLHLHSRNARMRTRRVPLITGRWLVCFLVMAGLMGLGLWGPAEIAAAALLSLSGNLPSLDLGAINPGQGPAVITGVIQLLVVAPDVPWDLTAVSQGPILNPGTGKTIPAGRLSLAVHGSSSWIPLGSLPVPLLSSQPPTGPEGRTVVLDAKFNAGWDCEASSPHTAYTAHIRYAVSSGNLLVAYAWPQPFVPGTDAGLSLLFYAPASAIPPFTVTVYDQRRSQVNGWSVAGPGEGWLRTSWDGRDSSGRSVTPGTYRFVVRDRDGGLLAAGEITVGKLDSTRKGNTSPKSAIREGNYPLRLAVNAPSGAAVGDDLSFTVQVENAGPCEIQDLAVNVTLPPGLHPKDADASESARELIWNPGHLGAGERVSFTYECVVLPLRRPLTVKVATRATGKVQGSPVQAGPVFTHISLSQGAFTGSGTIYGYAFRDANGNGRFDEGEPPLCGATVRTETGDETMTSDAGWFLFSKVVPGAHALKLIPGGAGIDGINGREGWPYQTLLIHVPPSGVVRADFAWSPGLEAPGWESPDSGGLDSPHLVQPHLDSPQGKASRSPGFPQADVSCVASLSLAQGQLPAFRIEGSVRYDGLRLSFGPSKGLEISHHIGEWGSVSGTTDRGISMIYTDSRRFSLHQPLGAGLTLSSEYEGSTRPAGDLPGPPGGEPSGGNLRLCYAAEISRGVSADLTAKLDLPSCTPSLMAGLTFSPAEGTSFRISRSFGSQSSATLTATYRRNTTLDMSASCSLDGKGALLGSAGTAFRLSYRPSPFVEFGMRFETAGADPGVNGNAGVESHSSRERRIRIGMDLALIPHQPGGLAMLASYLHQSGDQFSLSMGFEPSPLTLVSYKLTGSVGRSVTLAHTASLGRRLSQDLLLRLTHIRGLQCPTGFRANCTMIEAEAHITRSLMAVAGYSFPGGELPGEVLGFPEMRPKGPYLELALSP